MADTGGSVVERLTDAAMVLGTAPLTVDAEAGEELARDCEEGAKALASAREVLEEIVGLADEYSNRHTELAATWLREHGA